MAYVDLDKIINVTGGGSGTIYPDVPYPVLNQRIGIFNAPNARDTDSNGRFGLLGNSNAGICQQNYNFNQQMALAVDSGVGALSTRVKSYDFSVDIDKIDGGAIKWGLMKEGTSFFDINYVSKKIKDVYTNTNTFTIDGTKRKAHIVTSSGNKFMIYNTGVYPVSNNIPTSNVSLDTCLGSIIAIVGNTIWTGTTQVIDAYTRGYVGRIYTIDSVGALTLVDSQNFWTHARDHPQYGVTGYVNHYQFDNTIAYAIVDSKRHATYSPYPSNGYSTYFSIDLTNTTTFTKTDIFQYTGYSHMNDPIYFGGQYEIAGHDSGFVFIKGTDVAFVDASGLSILGAYTKGVNTIAYGSGLAIINTDADNISTIANYLNILGTTVGGDSLTTSYNNFIFLYEPTGVLSQDDSFVGILTNLTTIGETDTLTLSINSTLVETIENVLYNNGYGKTFTLPQIPLGTPAVEVQLDYANTLGNDLKLGFGITGGTYASPTLPANNGMSGNQTTARTAGSDASYIDLTLSTN